MKVNRWDIYIMGRYVFHVYYADNATEEMICNDLFLKGIVEEDTEFTVYKRHVEKD